MNRLNRAGQRRLSAMAALANCNGGSKSITVLNVGSGVGTYDVTPAHVAIHERSNSVSLAFLRSEPNRILRVLKHQPSLSGAIFF
jgi:hypothetical protein